MSNWRSRLIGAIAGVLLAQTAWAELPHGKLEFIQKTGTVSNTDTIDVWVRLTLDANSPALTFSSYPLTGISPNDLSQEGYHVDETGAYSYANFALINRAYIGASLTCGSFCWGQYQFRYGSQVDPDTPGPVYLDHFDLAPGQSYDYLFGRFTPQASGVSAGTYTLLDVSMLLYYSGIGPEGQWLSGFNFPVIASSCPDGDYATCGFSRTVVAVPEPSSYALLAFGLVAIGGVARRGAKRRV
ncbi:MAG TPA: PEP-CTERM sorting domain-containing protein [Burkholderiaceae bacterium]